MTIYAQVPWERDVGEREDPHHLLPRRFEVMLAFQVSKRGLRQLELT